MEGNRFLLIKAISHSLWKNLHHLMEFLLVAEITDRIPIVYWGSSCLYKEVLYTNAFDLYFETVSSYDIYDVIKKEFSFYPPIWKYDNLTSDDPNKHRLNYRNIGDFVGSDATVVVSDISIPVASVIPFVKKDHPVYGMTPVQIYRYLFTKYLKLKPDVKEEIQKYYDSKIKSTDHAIAVHMPGDFTLDIYPHIKRYNVSQIYHPISPNMNSKIRKNIQRVDHFQVDDMVQQHEIVRFLDVTQKGDPYRLFHSEIKKVMKKSNINKIFLITDREDILEQFSKEFGSMLIYSNYERIPNSDSRKPDYLETHMNMRSKGIEVLVDTYVASMCEFFIGYGFSNFSYGVAHLKDWPETNMKMMYWMYDKLYNFSYEHVKTGRYSPEESDGKYKIMTKRTQNSLKKIQNVFQ